MFIVDIRYKVPLEQVKEHLEAHRAYLAEGYKKNYFVASGPKNPKTGGIIISQLTNKETLTTIINQDPYYLKDIADYTITEFTPVLHHSDFAKFITSIND